MTKTFGLYQNAKSLRKKMDERGIIAWLNENGYGIGNPNAAIVCDKCAWDRHQLGPHLFGLKPLGNDKIYNKVIYCTYCNDIIRFNYSAEADESLIDSITNKGVLPTSYVEFVCRLLLKHSLNPSEELVNIADMYLAATHHLERSNETFWQGRIRFVETLYHDKLLPPNMVPFWSKYLNMFEKTQKLLAGEKNLRDFDSMYDMTTEKMSEKAILLMLYTEPTLLPEDVLYNYYINEAELSSAVFAYTNDKPSDNFREVLLSRCMDPLFIKYIESASVNLNELFGRRWQSEKIPKNLKMIREFAEKYQQKCGVKVDPAHLDAFTEDNPVEKLPLVKGMCKIDEVDWQKQYGIDFETYYQTPEGNKLRDLRWLLCNSVDDLMFRYKKRFKDKA